MTDKLRYLIFIAKLAYMISDLNVFEIPLEVAFIPLLFTLTFHQILSQGKTDYILTSSLLH